MEGAAEDVRRAVGPGPVPHGGGPTRGDGHEAPSVGAVVGRWAAATAPVGSETLVSLLPRTCAPITADTPKTTTIAITPIA